MTSRWIPVSILLSIFIILSLGSSFAESLTYDEPAYIEEGIRNLATGIFIEPYNPPLPRMIAMAPTVFLSCSPAGFCGRVVVIGLGTLMLYIVYTLAKRQYGLKVAIVSLFLLVFDPNILAFSHYVTYDIPFALTTFTAAISWLWFLRTPTRKNMLVVSFCTGLLLATKLLAIPFLVLFVVGVMLLLGRIKLFQLLHRWPLVIVALAGSIVVVWATYLFTTDIIIAPRADETRLSSRLRMWAEKNDVVLVQHGLDALEQKKMPLGGYLAIVKNTILRSQWETQVEWDGVLRTIVLKTPLVLLVLWGVGAYVIVRSRDTNGMALLAAATCVVVVAIITKVNPWIRYILPIYPFMAIVASVGIVRLRQSVNPVVLLFILIFSVVGTLKEYPHFISYANIFAGPSSERFVALRDANIDWGQSLPDLAYFIAQEQPEHVTFSYFGRDSGERFGLVSNREYGSWRFEEICAFHELAQPAHYGAARIVVISITNWHDCGYAQWPEFRKERVKEIIGGSLLLFN